MQPLESFDRAIVVTRGIVGKVGDDQLSLPTPCAEWNVRLLLNHILLGDLLVTAYIRGDVPPSREEDHLGEDPRCRVNEAMAACRDLVGEPGRLGAVTDTPMGQITVGAFVERRVADLTAHLWDLSRALGLPTDYDSELNEWVIGHYKNRLDGADRKGMPVAAEQPVPDGATAADRLAAYLGRVVAAS